MTYLFSLVKGMKKKGKKSILYSLLLFILNNAEELGQSKDPLDRGSYPTVFYRPALTCATSSAFFLLLSLPPLRSLSPSPAHSFSPVSLPPPILFFCRERLLPFCFTPASSSFTLTNGQFSYLAYIS